MKIPKLTIVAFSVFVAITIILVVLPNFEINSLRANMSANPDIPSYKFTESISMWQLYQVIAFQPASYIFFIVSVIILIVAVAQIVQMNYNLKPKNE